MKSETDIEKAKGQIASKLQEAEKLQSRVIQLRAKIAQLRFSAAELRRKFLGPVLDRRLLLASQNEPLNNKIERQYPE